MREIPQLMGRPKRLGGFTLIELLVAISIIAVLISMLIPVLGKARQTAYNIRCMGNLKQVGLAVMGYTLDNKQWMVPKVDEYTANAAGGAAPYGFTGFTPARYDISAADILVGQKYIVAPQWADSLSTAQYGGSVNLYPRNSPFSCPDAPTNAYVGNNWTRTQNQYWFTPLGGYRAATGAWAVTPNTWNANSGWFGPIRIDLVLVPSAHIVSADAGVQDAVGTTPTMDTFGFGHIGRHGQLEWQVFAEMVDQPMLHGGKPNTLFLDGSASVAPKACLDLYQTISVNAWLTDTSMPVVQKWARYFYPNPPANWAQ